MKRLLTMTEGGKPTEIRARAILMLLAIYGLRAGEVRHLRLDDFDWQRELLSVSCSKTRRTRIFPLSRPVGDAVLLYIKRVRPRTLHREVFLTLDGRPLGDGNMYNIVSQRLRRLGAAVLGDGDHKGATFEHTKFGRRLGAQDAIKEEALNAA